MKKLIKQTVCAVVILIAIGVFPIVIGRNLNGDSRQPDTARFLVKESTKAVDAKPSSQRESVTVAKPASPNVQRTTTRDFLATIGNLDKTMGRYLLTDEALPLIGSPVTNQTFHPLTTHRRVFRSRISRSLQDHWSSEKNLANILFFVFFADTTTLSPQQCQELLGHPSKLIKALTILNCADTVLQRQNGVLSATLSKSIDSALGSDDIFLRSAAVFCYAVIGESFEGQLKEDIRIRDILCLENMPLPRRFAQSGLHSLYGAILTEYLATSGSGEGSYLHGYDEQRIGLLASPALNLLSDVAHSCPELMDAVARSPHLERRFAGFTVRFINYLKSTQSDIVLMNTAGMARLYLGDEGSFLPSSNGLADSLKLFKNSEIRKAQTVDIRPTDGGESRDFFRDEFLTGIGQVPTYLDDQAEANLLEAVSHAIGTDGAALFWVHAHSYSGLISLTEAYGEKYEEMSPLDKRRQLTPENLSRTVLSQADAGSKVDLSNLTFVFCGCNTGSFAEAFLKNILADALNQNVEVQQLPGCVGSSPEGSVEVMEVTEFASVVGKWLARGNEQRFVTAVASLFDRKAKREGASSRGLQITIADLLAVCDDTVVTDRRQVLLPMYLTCVLEAARDSDFATLMPKVVNPCVFTKTPINVQKFVRKFVEGEGANVIDLPTVSPDVYVPVRIR